MTTTVALEFDSMCAAPEKPDTTRFSSNAAMLEAIHDRVHELLMLAQRPGFMMERRSDQRYAYPHLVRLTPVESDGQTPCGPPIVVAGSSLSMGGFGFFHPQPLTHRRMIASFHAGDGRWVGFLVDLPWCRFKAEGWYESGGRFLKAVPALPPDAPPDNPPPTE
ncbi:MAG TPA: hypothetical protein VMJ32_00480 [Pirellulales bacterium]|nr:hypothetical protein [Pirellulales bacterium]